MVFIWFLFFFSWGFSLSPRLILRDKSSCFLSQPRNPTSPFTLEKEQRFAFRKAVIRGLINEVQYWLECSQSFRLSLVEAQHFLRLAAYHGRVDIVEFFLDSGVEDSLSQQKGLSALHIASMRGHKDVIETLFRYGSSLQLRTKEGASALHIASLEGHYEIVDYLIRKKVNINALTYKGETALHMAIKGRRSDIGELLISKGIYVHVRTREGISAFVMASHYGLLDVLKFLIKRKRGRRIKKEDMISAFHAAVDAGNFEVVRFLISQNLSREFLLKSLFLTLQSPYQDMFDFIIHEGFPEDVLNGISPLAVLASWGYKKEVEYLLENKKRFHPKVFNFELAIYLACKYQHKEMITILLSHWYWKKDIEMLAQHVRYLLYLLPKDDIYKKFIKPLWRLGHFDDSEKVMFFMKIGDTKSALDILTYA